MAHVKMYPADIDEIPCMFCNAQHFADGSSPRKYTIYHGQHRLSEVFAICDDCAVELAHALGMGERLASEQYLVGRQARPIRSLLYDLSVALKALSVGDDIAETAKKKLLGDITERTHSLIEALDRPPIQKNEEEAS